MFVRWWWNESSLFFLPHPGRGPAQSAERVWPKRGSKTEGEEFVGFAERGVLVCRRSERERNEGFVKKVEFVENSRVFEACSGWLRSERMKAS